MDKSPEREHDFKFFHRSVRTGLTAATETVRGDLEVVRLAASAWFTSAVRSVTVYRKHTQCGSSPLGGSCNADHQGASPAFRLQCHKSGKLPVAFKKQSGLGKKHGHYPL